MGYTLSAQRSDEGHAMEGEFCDGRTDEVRDPAEGWRKYGVVMPGVRDLDEKPATKFTSGMKQCGLEGLSDRTRRPFRYANQLPEQIEAAIVAAKREKPHWGARKIRERLLRRLPHGVKVPAAQHDPRRSGSPRTGATSAAVANAC